MEKNRSRKRFLVEFVVFFSYALYSFSMESGNLYMKEIMTQFHIQSLAVGSHLSNANSLGKIIGTVLAGFVLYRLGARFAFFLSALCIALGTLLVPFASSFDMLLFFRFVMGLGGALMLSYIAGIVFQWFSMSEKTLVNSINGVAYSFGAALAISLAWSLSTFFGSWRNSLIGVSFLSFLFAFFWIFLIKKGELDDEKETLKRTSLKEIFLAHKKIITETQIILFGIGQAGVLGFYLCFLTFFPRYYVYEFHAAEGSLISYAPRIVSWTGILFALLGGVLAKYYTNRLMVLRVCSFIQIPSIIGLTFFTNQYAVTFCAVCLGISIFLAVSSYISYAQEWKGVDAKSLSIVFGLFWFIAYVFATPSPWVFGYLIDKTGSYTASFIFVVFLDSLYFISSMLLNKDGLRKSKL